MQENKMTDREGSMMDATKNSAEEMNLQTTT